MQMEHLIDIMFHHGGELRWNDDGTWVYEPDNKYCLADNDEDTMDVFFVRNYYKKLGYDKIDDCFWQVPDTNLANGLRELQSDNELMHMCQAARMNGGVVHVYYKHGVSKPYVVEDYVSTAAAANADDDDIAEVDEATFLKTKSSNQSSPPKWKIKKTGSGSWSCSMKISKTTSKMDGVSLVICKRV
ncbi:hypothetical protein PIB30_071757 [Stylosanthes scabra]|uniref:PB1-like domain-containing protein n=1 Tax=Stylosanthes scabra TaxID=79078 RepID=A0ABU6UNT5_9FABA|nr:hypothetical protein [Stylosanthes scabra]